MTQYSPKELFRKAAFIWTLMVVINVVLLSSLVYEGYFSTVSWLPYYWFGLSFIPLTLIFIYIKLTRKGEQMKTRGKPHMLSMMIWAFGLASIGCLVLSGWMLFPDNYNLIQYGPVVLLILQVAIAYYLPKPV